MREGRGTPQSATMDKTMASLKRCSAKYIYVDDMRYMKGKVYMTKTISFQSQMTT